MTETKATYTVTIVGNRIYVVSAGKRDTSAEIDRQAYAEQVYASESHGLVRVGDMHPCWALNAYNRALITGRADADVLRALAIRSNDPYETE